MKKHIAISSDPANNVAIEYAGSETFSTCTDYPFIFKALGKEQETSEEEVRKSTLAEEKEESPKGKRCKIISLVFSMWILEKAAQFPFLEGSKREKRNKLATY